MQGITQGGSTAADGIGPLAPAGPTATPPAAPAATPPAVTAPAGGLLRLGAPPALAAAPTVLGRATSLACFPVLLCCCGSLPAVGSERAPLLLELLPRLPVAPRTAASFSPLQPAAARCSGAVVGAWRAGLLLVAAPLAVAALVLSCEAPPPAAAAAGNTGSLADLAGASVCCRWLGWCMRWSSCCSSANRVASSSERREDCCCCCCCCCGGLRPGLTGACDGCGAALEAPCFGCGRATLALCCSCCWAGAAAAAAAALYAPVQCRTSTTGLKNTCRLVPSAEHHSGLQQAPCLLCCVCLS